MDCIYVFLEINDWEDIIIFLSKEDAINESKKYPNARVEIFSKKDKLDIHLLKDGGILSVLQHRKIILIFFYLRST